MGHCAHTTHFDAQLKEGHQEWARVLGVRANASRCSHAELDEAVELDDGNPVEFGQEYVDLKEALPKLSIMGGCCGTDHRHIEEIAKRCA